MEFWLIFSGFQIFESQLNRVILMFFIRVVVSLMCYAIVFRLKSGLIAHISYYIERDNFKG